MKVTEYMTLTNPSEAVLGQKKSYQGFAVHGDTAFQYFHSGLVAAFDLKTRAPEPIAVFKFGSFADNEPDKRYANHANQGMFGKAFYAPGDEFPLLYVTAGNSGEQDALGFIGRCTVERILRTPDGFTSECVQTIVYNDEGIGATPWETPGWGWFAHFADTEGGWYYTLSARFRTTTAFIDKFDENRYIITKFRLPERKEKGETVVLHPSDIVDQTLFPFDTFFTQGGVLKDNKIWYTFGLGTETYPDRIRVFDLEKREIVLRLDLSASIFGGEELECIDFYDGKLLVNTQAGKFYQIELDAAELPR